MKRPSLAATILALVVLAHLATILIADGRLTYTLDDAYVHLALAESIAVDGTYGINPGEPASPASSILWPFLLVPFAALPGGEFWPLVLNLAAAFATLAVYGALLASCAPSLGRGTAGGRLLHVLLIPATSVVGLLFTGMEHSLHLLLTALAVLGVTQEVREDRPPRWLWAVLVLGPLVRYEAMAVSMPLLLHLFLRGYRRQAVWTGTAILAALGSFSLFLLSLGLEPLPFSVTAKSRLFWDGVSVETLWNAVLTNLGRGQGDFLALALVGLVAAGLRTMRPARERYLGLCAALGVLLHFLFGQFGWYHRYEVYAWSFAVLVLLFLFRDIFERRLGTDGRETIRLALVLVLLVAVSCRGYLRALVTTPAAAANIYDQHYQMQRFVHDYLRGPVAVNDLGFVAFHNEYAVVDVFGLATAEALNARRELRPIEWMDDLAQSRGASCAMLYKGWFPRVPSNWIELGTLELRGQRISPAFAEVTFYATGKDAVVPVLSAMAAWQPTLPDPEMLRVTFVPPR